MTTPGKGSQALGAAIASQRERAQLTAAELAERADLSPETVRRIERGESDPLWTTLERIADALAVPLSRVLAEADRREQEGAGDAGL